MANEILGLFGGQNPQQLRNAALDSMLISPAQMGSQSLLQQVVSMGQNAGAMAGMGAGQLFGGKVAGEEKAAAITNMFKNIQAKGGDPSEQMFELSKQLGAAGYGAEAMQALDKANAFKNTSIAQRTAQAQARSAETSADVAERTASDKITLSGLDVDYRTANVASVKAQTDSVLASTARSKQLLPYEIEYKQAVVDKMEQELAERTDLAPLEKQELQGRIKAARFNLQQQQAQAPFALAKLQAESKALLNDENLRTALQALPENASNDDYMKVMRKYGDPNKVLAAITRTENQKAANEAKVEAAKIRADAKLAQMPKDVAEYVGNISLINSSDTKLDKYIKDIDENKVNFSVGGRLAAYADSWGTPSEKTLLAAQIDREFRQQANLILMAAKGVQTEGDAKRAYDQIIGSLEKYSNSGVKQALKDIKAWQQEIKKMNQAKIEARGYREYAKGTGGGEVDLGKYDK